MRIAFDVWARRHAVVLLVVMAGLLSRTARGQAEGGGSGDGYAPQAETYTVQQGDTLWSISERIAGSPWYWPRVWSYNPEITNPHWIYPGDVVRFTPSTLDLPHITELVADKRAMPEEPENEPPQVAPEPQAERKVVDRVVLQKRPPARESHKALVDLFVTEGQLQESGTLTNAVDDKLLLSKGDKVFVTFPEGQSGKTGQRYMVYRTLSEVHHPVSHDRIGYITELTGLLTVESTDTDVSRAKVTDSFVELERGQLVTPLVQVPIVDLKPRPAKAVIEGVVVAVETGIERIAGERRLVYVDLGKENGVEVGNKLNVYIQQDGVDPSRKLPSTPVGTLVVVDAKDTAATCLVVDAKREIEPGLTVRTVMSLIHPAGPGPAATGGG
jgi:hypothetical protein